MGNEIIEMYKSGFTNEFICNEFGISRYKLNKILKINKVEMKLKNFKVDDNFFENINTENKAYWFGFLYADGYVRKRKGYEFRLKLSSKDKKHIEKFKKDIKSNSDIRDFADNFSSISIYSKKFVENLINKGCLMNKSFIIKYPNLSPELHRHFIRGYFDGDGSVTNSSRTIVNFVSGSFEFIDDVRSILVDELNIYDCKIVENKNSYYISWSRKIDLERLYRFFYKNSNIFLKRKKKKFEEIINDKNDATNKYMNQKLFIFRGEKNIIVISPNLELAQIYINDKIQELNISNVGILKEYNTNKSDIIII